MRVSVIVPTRNRPDPLRIALASIAAQTYSDLEIVVVDDGSSPENARLNAAAAAALGRSVNYFRLPGDLAQGSGPSCARNAGIRAATGALIGFCDDDDYWCDDRHLETAAAALCTDETLDLVFANQAAHVRGQLVRERWLPELSLGEDSGAGAIGRFVRLPKRLCLRSHFPHMNTCVFRRQLLLHVGGFWESVRYHEDLDLFVRALDAARGVAYRGRTVSVHNVPDRSVAVNASTQLDETGKHLTNAYVANHLMECCRSRDMHQYARRMAGYAYRHLALEAGAAHRFGQAMYFARLALASRPTVKWAGYLTYVSLCVLLRRKEPAVPSVASSPSATSRHP